MVLYIGALRALGNLRRNKGKSKYQFHIAWPKSLNSLGFVFSLPKAELTMGVNKWGFVELVFDFPFSR